VNRRGLLLVVSLGAWCAALPRVVAWFVAAFGTAWFAVELARYFLRERRWRRRTAAPSAPDPPDPPDCGDVAEPIPGFRWKCAQTKGHEGPHEGYGLEWS
jgi:hypothetical protein